MGLVLIAAGTWSSFQLSERQLTIGGWNLGANLDWALLVAEVARDSAGLSVLSHC